MISKPKNIVHNLDMLKNLRKAFFDFFREKEHLIIPSSSVIPYDDPSILFINAGMAPLKNHFLDPNSLPYPVKNLASIQKCIRAGGKHNDLEEVGYTKRHHTFFEMCGNFSFGGYAHEEAIHLSWEFLTKKVGLDSKKLQVTVHPEDQKSLQIWKRIVPEGRIKFTEENEWSMGDSGPCGMCTEIFYDHDNQDPEEDRIVEVWNLVFMTHQVNAGVKTELEKTCVDTGMGLERLEAILAGTNDNYKAPLFADLIKIIRDKTGIEENPSHRIIADHSRSILFMISDGVLPDTGGRGYVLRKIIRRAVRHEQKLSQNGLIELSVDYMIGKFREVYPELEKNKTLVLDTVDSERDQFSETLIRGMHYLDKLTKGNDIVDGKTMFKLYDTYGLPIEIIKETLREKNLRYNIEEFEEISEENKLSSKKEIKPILNTSQCFFEGYFKGDCYTKITYLIKESEYIEIGTEKTVFYPKGGGQESDRGIITGENWSAEVLDVQKSINSIVHYCKLIKGMPQINDSCYMEINKERRIRLSQHHSATHLLLSALRKFLGEGIVQKGSLVDENRLRFDFLYNKSVNNLEEIEKQVNLWIEEANITELAEMSKKEAEEMGAIATFGERYGERVRVVKIGKSVELCGGTHVENSASIGSFYILSERGVAANVRRIEAVAGIAAYEYARSKMNLLSSLTKLTSVQEQDLYSYLDRKLKAQISQNVQQSDAPYLEKTDSNNSPTYSYFFFKNTNKSNLLKKFDEVNSDYVLVANRLEGKNIISIKSRGNLHAKDIISKVFEKFNPPEKDKIGESKPRLVKFGGGKDFAEGALDINIKDQEIIEEFIASIS